jgi:hypothetical protein
LMGKIREAELFEAGIPAKNRRISALQWGLTF